MGRTPMRSRRGRSAPHLLEAGITHDGIEAEQPDHVAAFGCLTIEHPLARLAFARLPTVRREVIYHGTPVARVQAWACHAHVIGGQWEDEHALPCERVKVGGVAGVTHGCEHAGSLPDLLPTLPPTYQH